VEHAARAEPLLELRVLRIVRVLRLLLGVEVVEIAEPLVEPMNGRSMSLRSPRWFFPNWPVA